MGVVVIAFRRPNPRRDPPRKAVVFRARASSRKLRISDGAWDDPVSCNAARRHVRSAPQCCRMEHGIAMSRSGQVRRVDVKLAWAPERKASSAAR